MISLEPCKNCSTPTTNRVDIEYDDEYGMACSESGVPTSYKVRTPICRWCCVDPEMTPELEAFLNGNI